MKFGREAGMGKMEGSKFRYIMGRGEIMNFLEVCWIKFEARRILCADLCNVFFVCNLAHILN